MDPIEKAMEASLAARMRELNIGPTNGNIVRRKRSNGVLLSVVLIFIVAATVIVVRHFA